MNEILNFIDFSDFSLAKTIGYSYGLITLVVVIIGFKKYGFDNFLHREKGEAYSFLEILAFILLIGGAILMPFLGLLE